MGHKVHPYGFRIGIIKPWLAKWYADRDYASLLQEDMRIRELVARQLANASVSQVEIERGINHVTVTVHTAKPGIVIGKGGANVEALRTAVGKLTNKKVKLEIKEILQPELDGMLVAQNVAGQLERRIAFRKAIKQAIQRSIKAGAKGVKIQVSGRLGGAEMSRTEWDKEGRIPLGTLRADISYGVVLARTTYGAIGVKAWVYRGEQLGDRPGSARTEPRAPRRGPAGGRTNGGGAAAPARSARGGRRAAPSDERPTTEAPAAADAQPETAVPTAAAQETPKTRAARKAAPVPTEATEATEPTEAPAVDASAATAEVAESPADASAPEAPAADESTAAEAAEAPAAEAREPTAGEASAPAEAPAADESTAAEATDASAAPDEAQAPETPADDETSAKES